jgi:hypothetical protein
LPVTSLQIVDCPKNFDACVAVGLRGEGSPAPLKVARRQELSLDQAWVAWEQRLDRTMLAVVGVTSMFLQRQVACPLKTLW